MNNIQHFLWTQINFDKSYFSDFLLIWFLVLNYEIHMHFG